MVTASNLPDSSSGRPFASSFTSQSVSAPGFHHSGGMQALHNIHQSFNVTNMQGSLSRNAAALSGVPSSGVQQPGGGGLSSGRFGSSNLPVAMSQMSHGSLHGHSGVTNRGGITVVGNPSFSGGVNGGSLPGISSNALSAGNRSSFPGLGASHLLGNVGPRITNSIGNIVGGSNIGRSVGSGGLAVPGLASRVNLGANSGSGSLNLQGHNRLMSGMHQQVSPQMLGMLGGSYATSGGTLSQSQLQGGNNALSSMGMLNDMNNDNAPFDLKDFPELTGRPNSAGGPQGQLGSLRKQGVGVSSIVQQSQEFSIQNEDFPALPGFKGGNSDFPMDMHQKEQLHDNASMMHSQHFPMARTAGFGLGGTYASTRQQQQQHGVSLNSGGVGFTPGNNQDLMHLRGSDLFSSSHGTYQSQIQNNGPPGMGLRPMNSPSSASGMGSYELLQQYQHTQPQFRLQQMSDVSQSFGDQSKKSLQGSQPAPDRFSLLGLLNVIRNYDPDLTSLALGIDLTTLGLNLNSSDCLYKMFGSPWSDEPAKGEPEYSIPSCYYSKPLPRLHEGHFERFHLSTLFYIFYSMPRDEAQLLAASALYSRGWFYHKEHQLWFTRVGEPLVKQATYERGTYLCFIPNSWETIRKENFIVHYDSIEKISLAKH